MNQPLVSVIIPVYNLERYLVDAIESVRAQDYAPVELIVVDDGSTDASAETIGRMGAGIRYVYQANQGIGGARNTGIALATGSFLAFLDSDDVWLSDKLTRQTAVFASDPETDAVYGHAEQFYSPEIEPGFWRRIRTQPGLLPAPLPSAMIIRRTAFDRVGPFDPRLGIGVEIDWFARLTERQLVVVMLQEVVFRRRLHRSNFSIRSADEPLERVRVLKAAIDRRRGRAADPEPGEALPHE